MGVLAHLVMNYGDLILCSCDITQIKFGQVWNLLHHPHTCSTVWKPQVKYSRKLKCITQATIAVDELSNKYWNPSASLEQISQSILDIYIHCMSQIIRSDRLAEVVNWRKVIWITFRRIYLSTIFIASYIIYY